MQLFVSRGAYPNFGDELNLWLWPKLVGPVWNESDSDIFLGIGSILYDSFPSDSRKIVFGAGYGGYTAKPDIHDGSWEIYFVRGPQTAEVLGLHHSLAITDPAVLIRVLDKPAPAAKKKVSFIPHYESIERGNWMAVCSEADIHFIDPRSSVDTVISQILASEVLVTEAMHGAIVADALRIPWVPVRPISQKHHFKWIDWARSLDLSFQMFPLKPSSSRELWIWSTGRLAENERAKRFASSNFAKAIDNRLISLAAKALVKASESQNYLSKDGIIDARTNQVLDKLYVLKKDFCLGIEGG